MTLYNCRHSGDQYRISKFDDDMNVESSYLCTLAECDCPAGVRPTCRHRQMLPRFIDREHVGDEWFFDFDRGGWVQMGQEWIESEEPLVDVMESSSVVEQGNHNPLVAGSIPASPTITFVEVPQLPEGVTMIVMDHPDKVVEVHNAIADAVGEPEAKLPAKRYMQRRL